MAVTQILLRTSVETAKAASSSSEALLQLLEVPDEILDLDWAPKPLEDAYRLLGQDQHASLISRACEGGSILNSVFPNGTESYSVYSDIKIHSPSQVGVLASLLEKLPLDSLSQVAFQLLPAMDSPASYLQKHAMNLVGFYNLAAVKKQVVVTWWD
jgi:hypothetical protein